MRRFRPRGGPRRQRRGLSVADVLLAVALLGGCAALVALLPQEVLPPPITGQSGGSTSGQAAGQVYVIDGDSIRLGGTEIRLAGIDAPELRQTCERYGETYQCGRAARAALLGKLARGSITCHPQGLDRYSRTLAICMVGGEDVNAALVREGMAVDYGDRYAGEEAAARAARRGVWAGTFDQPSEWRMKHPRNGKPPQDATP